MKRALLCLALFLSACRDGTPDDVIQSDFAGLDATYHCMEWKGTQRCYYVVLPKEHPKHLIVALHPAFTSVAMTEMVSHMAATAVPRGYLVVYPEGIDKQWNDFRVMTEVKTYQDKTDDVGFIDAVTTKMQKEYKLTPAQTTVAGMSSGGMMSLRMACQSDKYGSVATVVANLPKGLRDHCVARPKKMLMIFGTHDDIVDYGGGVLGHSGIANEWGEVESAKLTQAFFDGRNDCGKAVQTNVLADPQTDSTRAVRTDHTGCRVPLSVINVERMGHTWPGEESRLLAWATTRGVVTHQFKAAENILDFIEH